MSKITHDDLTRSVTAVIAVPNMATVGVKGLTLDSQRACKTSVEKRSLRYMVSVDLFLQLARIMPCVRRYDIAYVDYDTIL